MQNLFLWYRSSVLCVILFLKWLSVLLQGAVCSAESKQLSGPTTERACQSRRGSTGSAHNWRHRNDFGVFITFNWLTWSRDTVWRTANGSAMFTDSPSVAGRLAGWLYVINSCWKVQQQYSLHGWAAEETSLHLSTAQWPPIHKDLFRTTQVHS